MEKKENNFSGKDGFVWFIGVIEDRQDPLKIGRCRVRFIGWHSENKFGIRTEELPWCEVLLSPTFTNIHTPREGDMVFGFFKDGNAAQSPVIMGVFPKIPTKGGKVISNSNLVGFKDGRKDAELLAAPVKPNEKPTRYPRNLNEPTTSRLARNDANYPSHIVESKKSNKESKVEPDPYYNAKYPYNNVYESESGHALEFDDTKGAERVHLYHRSGSYTEWGPEGDRAERIQRNKFEVVVGNEEVYVKGDVKIYVDGDYDLNVTGDIRINGKTINLNQGTKGAARIGDQTLDNDSELNGADTGIIQTGSSTVVIGN